MNPPITQIPPIPLTSRHSSFVLRTSTFASVSLCLCVFLLGRMDAQKVILSIPTTLQARVGDTVQVPILVSNQASRGVISADVALSFRQSVLTATDQYRLGNSTPSGWLASTNPFSCSLLIALAGADPLQTGDTLIVVKMLARTVDTTTIGFLRCKLNEGNVPCSTRVGKFTGRTGIAEQFPGASHAILLEAYPNPATGPVGLSISVPDGSRTRLEISDAAGRPVRVLPVPAQPGGSVLLVWDRRDRAGRNVPAGVYFLRLTVQRAGPATECQGGKLVLR